MSSYYKKSSSRRVAKAKPRTNGNGAYKPKKRATSGRRYYSKKSASSSSGGWLAPALSTVGSLLPIPGGSAIGNAIGNGIKYLTGFGDYEVKQNSLLSEGNSPPMIVNAKDKYTTVRHREFIQNIYSSSSANTFNIEGFDVCPTNSKTFPWLNNIAKLYQQWRLDGLIFEFKSMSGNALNSTNTALGTVIACMNYNSSDPLYTSEFQMLNSEYSTSSPPSCDQTCIVECAREQNVLTNLYTLQSNIVPDGEDPKTYNFGKFQLATSGLQGTNVLVGQLWVSYEVTLLKARLEVDPALSIPYVWFANVTTNSCARNVPFGSTKNSPTFSTVPGGHNCQNSAINFKNLNSGDYLVNVNWTTSANFSLDGTDSHPTITFNLGSSATLLGYPIFTPKLYNTGSTSNAFFFQFAFRVTGYDKDVTIGVALPDTPAGNSITVCDGYTVQMNQIPSTIYP